MDSKMNTNQTTTQKKTSKKVIKRDLVQEQRESFIRANSVPEAGKSYAEYLYREAVARFPYPTQTTHKVIYLD